MSLILPRRFASQPQGAATVDWSNPVTRGLRALFDGATGREVISSAWPVSDTSVRGVTARGLGRSYSGSTTTRFAHRPAFAQTGALTLVALVDIRTLTGYSSIISKQGSSVTDCPYEWRLGGFGPDAANLLLLRANTSYFGQMTSVARLAPGFSGVIGVSAASGELQSASAAWVSGVRYPFDATTNNGTGIATDTGTSQVFIGGRQDDATHLDGQIYYVAVYGRELSAAEMRSLSDNPWQIFKAPARRLWIDAGSASIVALAGAAQAIAAASGALSIAVPLAAAAVGVATANGALSTAIKLSGGAAAIASASGKLALGVVLSGAALAQAFASGTLASRFPLGGTALAQTGASGNLSVSNPTALAGAATAHAAATGVMTIQVALSGAAVAKALSTGNLTATGATALSGTAQSVSTASGALSVSIPLAGAAQVVSGATGNLSSGKPLAGAAVAVAAAAGSLMVTVKLSGVAVAQAIASGGLSMRVPLSGSAIAHASAIGSLSGGLSPTVGDTRFTVRARQRNFTVPYAH